MRTTIRKPTAERRREVAEAVLRIIGEQGLPALTTGAVAEAVGVTSGALFRHFASRDEMLAEAARQALEEVEATFPEEDLPPLERIGRLARNRVRLFAGDPGLAWLMRSDQAHLVLPAGAVEALRGAVRRSRDYLLAALREGASTGAVRDDLEPEALLVVVMGAIHALVGMAGVHGEVDAPAGEVGRVLDGLVRLLKPLPPGGAAGLRDETKQPEEIDR